MLGSERPSSPPTSFYSGGNNTIKRLRKEIFKSKKMRARSLVSEKKEHVTIKPKVGRKPLKGFREIRL